MPDMPNGLFMPNANFNFNRDLAHIEHYAQFVNSVPPERFLVVMGATAIECVLALMPRNSLEDVTVVTNAINGRTAYQVNFKLYQSRALTLHTFRFDSAVDCRTMTAVYLNLIGRGITGRLATIHSISQRDPDSGRVWSMESGCQQLEDLLMSSSPNPAPAPAAVQITAEQPGPLAGIFNIETVRRAAERLHIIGVDPARDNDSSTEDVGFIEPSEVTVPADRATGIPTTSFRNPNVVAGSNGTITRVLSNRNIAVGVLLVMNPDGTVMPAPPGIDPGVIIGRCIRSTAVDFDQFETYVQVCDPASTPPAQPEATLNLGVGEFSQREEIAITAEALSSRDGQPFGHFSAIMHGGKVRLELYWDQVVHCYRVATTLVHSGDTAAAARIAREIARTQELEAINARLTDQVAAANEMLRTRSMPIIQPFPSPHPVETCACAQCAEARRRTRPRQNDQSIDDLLNDL